MNNTPSPPPLVGCAECELVPPIHYQSSSPINCGQYYVFLADITAHHTGYHKLVEAPTLSRRSSSSPPLPPRDTMVKGTKTPNDQPSGIRQLLVIGTAEMLGTAFLVLIGCMGCMDSLTSSADRSPLRPALVFGFAVAAIIQMFGHISKAHLNPAITLAAVVLRVCTWKVAIVYAVSQCIGAIVGFGFLKALTPHQVLDNDKGDFGFCTTHPNKEITTVQAILTEFFATAVLIFVLCGSWDRRNSHLHDSVAIKFGLTIVALALAAGPYTGGSMNPARSLGPAFWDGDWTHHWIYWFAPLLSAATVAFFYRLVFEQNEEDEVKNRGEGDGTGYPLNPTASSVNADENGTNFSSV